MWLKCCCVLICLITLIKSVRAGDESTVTTSKNNKANIPEKQVVRPESVILELKSFINLKLDTIHKAISNDLKVLNEKIFHIEIKLENLKSEIISSDKNIKESFSKLEKQINFTNNTPFTHDHGTNVPLQNRIDDKINQITLKLDNLYNMTKEKSIIGENIYNQSKLKATYERETLRAINNTCANVIKYASNSDILTKINITTTKITETLDRVLNVCTDTLGEVNRTLNDTRKLKDVNDKVECSVLKLNTSETVAQVTPSTEMSTNKSQEAEWGRCQEESVPDTRSIWDVQLHPLAAAGVRAVFRADGRVWVFLSREPRVDTSHGLYFVSLIGKTHASLHVVDAGRNKMLHTVQVGTNFSTSHDTRLMLAAADDGTLEVHVGDASTPLLRYWDPRITQINYFGFFTLSNSQGYAKFKYDCQ